MTLNEIFAQIPMGLGYVARTVVQTRAPALAERLDTPIRVLRIEFTTGDPLVVPLDELEGQNATPRDDRPGLAGNPGASPGTPGIPG